MSARIITDSLSDINSEIAQKLDITVVPLTVLFGREAFLDRVTISPETFYDRLVNGSVWPTTTQPTPAAFAEIYDKLGETTDELLVVTLSKKMSGTYQSAMGAKPMVKKKLHIEVIDSEAVAMGLGQIVIAAAKEARKGGTLIELVEFVKQAKLRSHWIAYFDTLKYLAKGGRIGKAQAWLGSLLSVKPLLTVREGEMAPVTRVRSQSAGMDYLYNFATPYAGRIEAIAVEHTTATEMFDKLTERFATLVPRDRIYRATVSPVLGTYGGPSAGAVTVFESAGK